jgi:hypothetical protein
MKKFDVNMNELRFKIMEAVRGWDRSVRSKYTGKLEKKCYVLPKDLSTHPGFVRIEIFGEHLQVKVLSKICAALQGKETPGKGGSIAC